MRWRVRPPGQRASPISASQHSPRPPAPLPEFPVPHSVGSTSGSFSFPPHRLASSLIESVATPTFCSDQTHEGLEGTPAAWGFQAHSILTIAA